MGIFIKLFQFLVKTRKGAIIFILCVAVFCLCIVFLLFGNIKDDSIISTQVRQGTFQVTVTTVGELSSNDCQKVFMPMNELQKVGVNEISLIQMVPDSGDMVAVLDNTPLFALIKDADKAIETALSELSKAKLDTSLSLTAERDKYEELRGAIEEARFGVEQSQYESPATIRQANKSLNKALRDLERYEKGYLYKSSEARISVAAKTEEYQKKLMQKQELLQVMENLTLRSPGRGMVVYERVGDGSKIKVGTKYNIYFASVIVSLPEMSKLISKTWVNEIEIDKIRKGQKVKVIADAFMDKSYKGTVISVANIGSPMQGHDGNVFEVNIEVTNYDGRLKPSMRTNNFIQTASYDKAIYLPTDALMITDSMSFVYLKKGRKISLQQVETGEANENEVLIKRGLSDKEMVLLSFPESDEGIPVKMLEEKPTLSKR
jgi:HlyD family secretion protein